MTALRHPRIGALRRPTSTRRKRSTRDVLGLELIARVEGRHVFFRCGDGVLLLFNAEATEMPPAPDAQAAGAAARRAPARAICALRRRADEIARWKTAS